MRKLLTFGLITLTTLAMTTTSAQAILNGTPTKTWNGFTVGLHSTDRIEASANLTENSEAFYSQFCGGALVTPTKVVTAAHCLVSMKNLKFEEKMLPEKLLIGYGHDLNKDTYTMVEVDTIEVHPLYKNSSVINDIAVITLKTPVVGSKPLQISTQNNSNLEKPFKKANIYGWGGLGAEVYAYGENFPSELQKGEVYLAPKKSCGGDTGFKLKGKQIFPLENPELVANPNTTLCAVGLVEEKFIDTCGGDSGGPLVDLSNKILLGVTSWGYGCVGAMPGAYAKVSSYTTFLQQNGVNP